MSDRIIKIIPTSPKTVPDNETIEKVVKIIEGSFKPFEKVEVKVTENIHFIDAEANFGTVKCPYDQTILSEEWWKNAMETAYKTNFIDLKVQLPCCNRNSSLNDLSYEWSLGFARFVIEIINPTSLVDSETLKAIGSLIGVKLKIIEAHH